MGKAQLLQQFHIGLKIMAESNCSVSIAAQNRHVSAHTLIQSEDFLILNITEMESGVQTAGVDLQADIPINDLLEDFTDHRFLSSFHFSTAVSPVSA